jgi:DNA-binding MarR family transcriptional regulator
MRPLSDTEVNRLKQIVGEGVQVMDEVTTLNEGLNDTVKAIAEELDLKPAMLKKAIRTAYKAEFSKAREDFDELEEILKVTGRDF